MVALKQSQSAKTTAMNCIQLAKLCSHAVPKRFRLALDIAHLQFDWLHQLKQFFFFICTFTVQHRFRSAKSLRLLNPFHSTYSYNLKYERCYIFVASICKLQIDIYHLPRCIPWNWSLCYHEQWIRCTAYKQAEWIETFCFFLHNRMLKYTREKKINENNVIDSEVILSPPGEDISNGMVLEENIEKKNYP